jgi:hypothetical protein
MRTTVVRAAHLQDDLRASAYVDPTDEELRAARLAGWDCGAVGMSEPQTRYAYHPHQKVRDVVQKAFAAGLKARKEYLG